MKIPILVPLDRSLTEPCPLVASGRPINTEVDGALQTAREKVRADCNARKLEIIQEAQP